MPPLYPLVKMVSETRLGFITQCVNSVRLAGPIEDDYLEHLLEKMKKKLGGMNIAFEPGTFHFRVVFLPSMPVLSEAYDKFEEFVNRRYPR